MLRWLTAGESHGPALVAVLEGLPAGVHTNTGEIADALARRRAGYGRGARMSFERDEVEFLGGVRHGRDDGRPGRDPGRQHRVAQVGDGDGAPTRSPPRSSPSLGPQRAAHPAAARPRRPRRHAEVRLRRRAPGARAGQRPRDRRPGRARARRPGVPARRSPDVEVLSHVVAHRRRHGAATARVPVPGRPRDRIDADPVRCLDPARERSDGRRDRRRPQGRRHPRRRRRGRRSTACRRASAVTCTGTGASTPGSPAPSWASRPSRASRSATASRRPGGAARDAHDEIDDDG